MIKRNQISLILLTVIMMLTVYYIKTTGPDESAPVDGVVSTGDLEKNPEYAAMRLSVEEERNQLLMVFNDIIGDSETTVEEKTLAIEAMKEINLTSEKEQLLEMEIIDFGYFDAFVHSSGDQVTVNILTDEFSAHEANEIIKMTILEFGEDVEVTLKFDTEVSEVVNK